MKSKGYQIIKDESLFNTQISPQASIAESKLNLYYGTDLLYDDMVSKNRDSAIASGIFLTIPATGIKWIDAITGQTYVETCENGIKKLSPL